MEKEQAFISCTRRLQFAAGHRVYNHEGKCANLHGHNYVVYLHARAERLDSIGRVIDFSVLKDRIGGWIDEQWDHGFLYYEKDLEAKVLFEHTEAFITQKSFSCEFNPTAEEMARYILLVVGPICLYETSVQLHKVTLWETENCYAEASL